MQKANAPLFTNQVDLNSIHFEQGVELPFRQEFHTNRLEDVVPFLKFPLMPHRKNLYDFIFITKGSSVRCKGLDCYEFSKNHLFFHPAYQISSHKSISPDIQGYFCQFDLSIFADYVKPADLIKEFSFLQSLGNPIVEVSDETAQVVTFLLNRILTEYTKQESIDLALIRNYILAIFAEAKAHVTIDNHLKRKDSPYQITERYKNALSQYIYEKQSINDYAQLLHVSANYLNKCVKYCTNQTAQDLLNDTLILEAKTLLKYSTYQISEIAVHLCNQTPSNFARFFKSKTGLTPKEFVEM